MVLLGVLAYGNSFQGVFLFDDHGEITDNARIRSLAWPWDFVENVRRPFLYLLLAVNYAWGGYNPWGYHLVNLVVHILAGLFLFGVVRQTCRLFPPPSSLKKDALPIAFVTAAIWLVHPLQTQSVTYVVQRAESLAGMLYLAALYAAVRYFQGRHGVWLGIASPAALFSGLTKETAVTIPLVVLLYDRTFVSETFRAALKKHWRLYAGLAVTWGIMFFLLFTTNPEKTPTAGFSFKGISSWQYALSQPDVFLHYLRLSLWPHPLILDYAWPPVKDAGAAIPSLIVLFLLANIMIGAFIRGIWYRPLGFLGMAFFIILLPSSSFIPLKDVVFEHRMYLSLACVVLLGVLAARSLLRKKFFPEELRPALAVLLVCAVVGVFSFLTVRRNQDYHSELTMWKDVMDKQPLNARAHNNYGKQLVTIPGREEEARRHCQTAIELDPDYADAHLNMGSLLAQMGELEGAVNHSQKAIDLNPEYAIAFNNLGAALSEQGKPGEAIAYFQKALNLGFIEKGVYRNLGIAFAQTGRPHEAVASLQEALKLDPHYADARRDLAEIVGKMK